MLLIVEKGIRGRICHALHRYENYDENITSSYLTYLDANNLYRWAMSQK